MEPTRRRLLVVGLVVGLVIACCARAGPALAVDAAPLTLESKILLGDVRGRIDHLAVDLGRKRLFVAELGNDSVAVVDLAAGKLLRRIGGLKEPQGLGFVPSVDALYVANARDGSVQVFDGEDYTPSGRIDLGDDADNVRVDLATNVVFIGYGAGALAAIDPMTRKKVADIPLKAHPEGFQVDSSTGQIFVNLPQTRSIGVIDRASGRLSASWPTGSTGDNFPMALDKAGRHAVVVFRNPTRLGVFAMSSGDKVVDRETCGDSDDVFVDAIRKRVYVSCGEGFIDVFDVEGASYQRLARIPTAAGARTSLFIPAMDRFVVAVRATAAQQAAIWVYRAVP
jgi:DNA-binding beta-propeller fold protein YncE